MVIEVPEWVVEVDWRDIMLLAARPFLTRDGSRSRSNKVISVAASGCSTLGEGDTTSEGLSGDLA
jgi:hypothetical protein